MRLAAAAPRGFVDRATRRSGSSRDVEDEGPAVGAAVEEEGATAAIVDTMCWSDETN